MHMRIRRATLQLMRTLSQTLPPVLVLVWLCATSAAQTSAAPKRVLLLFPGESHTPPQPIIEESLRSTLTGGSTAPIEIFSEYLDSTRTKVANHETELVALLRLKYQGIKFDVIVAFFAYPLSFLVRHQTELFGDTPIVVLKLDFRGSDFADLNWGPNMTGLWGELDVRPNLEFALKMHPGTKKVVMVSGVGIGDQWAMTKAREGLRVFEGQVEFDYLEFQGLSETIWP